MAEVVGRAVHGGRGRAARPCPHVRTHTLTHRGGTSSSSRCRHDPAAAAPGPWPPLPLAAGERGPHCRGLTQLQGRRELGRGMGTGVWRGVGWGEVMRRGLGRGVRQLVRQGGWEGTAVRRGCGRVRRRRLPAGGGCSFEGAACDVGLVVVLSGLAMVSVKFCVYGRATLWRYGCGRPRELRGCREWLACGVASDPGRGRMVRAG